MSKSDARHRLKSMLPVAGKRNSTDCGLLVPNPFNAPNRLKSVLPLPSRLCFSAAHLAVELNRPKYRQKNPLIILILVLGCDRNEIKQVAVSQQRSVHRHDLRAAGYV